MVPDGSGNVKSDLNLWSGALRLSEGGPRERASRSGQELAEPDQDDVQSEMLAEPIKPSNIWPDLSVA